MKTDQEWMQVALALAKHAAEQGEVPVGAVLVRENEMVASAWNQPIGRCDPSAHAEILCLRQAGEIVGNYRLVNTTLYVTLEPCLMCVGALVHARVKRVVFGALDPKVGAMQLEKVALNHRLEYTGGVLAEESSALLQAFFKERR